jgi:hypothetical protein
MRFFSSLNAVVSASEPISASTDTSAIAQIESAETAKSVCRLFVWCARCGGAPECLPPRVPVCVCNCASCYTYLLCRSIHAPLDAAVVLCVKCCVVCEKALTRVVCACPVTFFLRPGGSMQIFVKVCT